MAGRAIVDVFVSVLTAPYRRTFKLYTWKPIREIRETSRKGDRKLLVQNIRDFKTGKYQELQSVQVAASFCTGVTLSTISWTRIPHPMWIPEALWYSSLICSIWAVITSIQAKSILDDLPSNDELKSPSLPESDLKRSQRAILRYKKRPGIGHCMMLFIWQFSSMTMSYAWCTFLSGLTLYVCTPFVRRDPWSNRHNIAIAYLAVFGVGLITFCFSSAFVYASEKEYERSIASTRTNTNTSSEFEGPQHPQSTVDPIQAARAKILGNEERSGYEFQSTDRSNRPKLLI
ncbi:hypothetical protein BDV96DRAFT_604956 [Lophiotrema nucula]|uniref:DUF6535 domain-containing protein n=1 Tax=Lophiotrema nucula TaxID=690887 RepID=A0A6A5YQ09_9PLEO|nr:hypothetical protein BDV96DRAFT_604956 [Lophiotrema nucula]